MKQWSLRNKEIDCMPTNPTGDAFYLHSAENELFFYDTIEGFKTLIPIIKSIRCRLLQEGYKIENGKAFNPKGELIYERKK